MNLRCLLGKHSLGPPRVDAAGVTVMECLICLRIQPARVSLGSKPDEPTVLEDRRARAIAELVANKRWAGLASDPVDVRSPSGGPRS
jgi:hypothetical protein